MQLSSETLKFIKEHQEEDMRMLALQAARYPLVDMPAAITQITGLQIIKEKVPAWHATDGLIYPKHLSLEQCSSEITARYKASLLKGDTLIDLTGGFGVDCTFFAPNFKKVVYVERQNELCKIATHNFPILELHHIKVINADSVEYLRTTDKVSCIFIDPARRNTAGRKVTAITDCEPDVKSLSSLLLNKADKVMVKLSPMLDLSLALSDMPETCETHIVSVCNECKELLLILNNDKNKENKIYCINLDKKGNMQCFVFTRENEQSARCDYTSTIHKYLYEPNAAILKAGAYKCVANIYKIKKLHPNSHLYTADELIKDFPGRVFSCLSVFSLHKKEMKKELNGISHANITVRNFPASVAELRKRTKLKEGGDTYLFATTLADEKKVLIKCGKAFEKNDNNLACFPISM